MCVCVYVCVCVCVCIKINRSADGSKFGYLWLFIIIPYTYVMCVKDISVLLRHLIFGYVLCFFNSKDSFDRLF